MEASADRLKRLKANLSAQILKGIESAKQPDLAPHASVSKAYYALEESGGLTKPADQQEDQAKESAVDNSEDKRETTNANRTKRHRVDRGDQTMQPVDKPLYRLKVILREPKNIDRDIENIGAAPSSCKNRSVSVSTLQQRLEFKLEVDESFRNACLLAIYQYMYFKEHDKERIEEISGGSFQMKVDLSWSQRPSSHDEDSEITTLENLLRITKDENVRQIAPLAKNFDVLTAVNGLRNILVKIVDYMNQVSQDNVFEMGDSLYIIRSPSSSSPQLIHADTVDDSHYIALIHLAPNQLRTEFWNDDGPALTTEEQNTLRIGETEEELDGGKLPNGEYRTAFWKRFHWLLGPGLSTDDLEYGFRTSHGQRGSQGLVEIFRSDCIHRGPGGYGGQRWLLFIDIKRKDVTGYQPAIQINPVYVAGKLYGFNSSEFAWYCFLAESLVSKSSMHITHQITPEQLARNLQKASKQFKKLMDKYKQS